MVRIINYKKIVKDDGSIFRVLEIQGGIEMVKSKQSGSFYATARKSFVPSTFSEAVCKALIGTEMEGSIQKVKCTPYDYTIKETGEIIELSHKYEFVPEGENSIVPEPPKDLSIEVKEDTFSKNGALEHA